MTKYRTDAVKLPLPPDQLRDLIAKGSGGVVFQCLVRRRAQFAFARFEQSGAMVVIGYHVDTAQPEHQRTFLLVPTHHEFDLDDDVHVEPLDLVLHPDGIAAFVLHDITGPEVIFGS